MSWVVDWLYVMLVCHQSCCVALLWCLSSRVFSQGSSTSKPAMHSTWDPAPNTWQQLCNTELEDTAEMNLFLSMGLNGAVIDYNCMNSTA